ncbi:MAG: hypothetical protein HY787_28870 [Deltaproteobacteria bacterium]|nr:hypothetical protein [Deltaproteobacteria bacterium]
MGDKALRCDCISAFWFMILICGLLFSVKPLSAGTNEDLLQKLKSAETLKLRYEDRRALDIYETVLLFQPNHPEALWNAAYLHVRLGWLGKDRSIQLRHFQQAYAQASRIFQLNPERYEAHFVLWAAKANLAEFAGNGEKVKAARELEDHSRFLLKQRSDDPEVWYFLAWWHFKIARVSRTDRFFAALLFGGLPTGASTDQAIKCLQKAIILKPDYSVFHHDLGLFYERTGNPVKAYESYRLATSISPQTPEDYIYIEKARRKLAKIKSQVP